MPVLTTQGSGTWTDKGIFLVIFFFTNSSAGFILCACGCKQKNNNCDKPVQHEDLLSGQMLIKLEVYGVFGIITANIITHRSVILTRLKSWSLSKVCRLWSVGHQNIDTDTICYAPWQHLIVRQIGVDSCTHNLHQVLHHRCCLHITGYLFYWRLYFHYLHKLWDELYLGHNLYYVNVTNWSIIHMLWGWNQRCQKWHKCTNKLLLAAIESVEPHKCICRAWGFTSGNREAYVLWTLV